MDESLFKRQLDLAIQILIHAGQGVTIDYLREKVKALTRASRMLPGVSLALRHDKRVHYYRRKGIDKYLWKGESNEAITREKAKIAGDIAFQKRSYDIWKS